MLNGGNYMVVHIENCNSILNGSIEIVEGALNVKYAINGTGKSTIAKAIFASVTNDTASLQQLKPYQYIGEDGHAPQIAGINHLQKVMIFDESYVNQYVYLSDDLVKDSFEIFVKTPDYDRHMQGIQTALREINQSFRDSPELDLLIRAFSQFVDGCGHSQTGLATSGAIYKAFGKGNHINHVPVGLEAYAPYLCNTQDANNVKWIKWQSEGLKFLDIADQCPYCSGSVVQTKDQIKRVSDEFDSKAVEHLNRMLSLFNDLSPYFSPATNATLSQITNNADAMTAAQKSYLYEVKTQVTTVLQLLQMLKDIGFQAFKDVDRVVDHLQRHRIDLTLFSHLQSDLMNDKIGMINTSLDSVIDRAGQLQGEVNQQKRLIKNTIEANTTAINNFLSCAGYNYSVSISDDHGESYKMILRPKNVGIDVGEAKEHLSYGERNALALALFMFSALKENPDIVILDDPISSFDGNKKFALLNMLFMTDRCLRNRTVLMLTHEFNTVIDIISTMPYNFNPAPHAAFLSTRNGILTERAITKSDILSFKEIAMRNIRADSDILNKAVFLRRLLEAEGEKDSAWHLLSNLFHKRRVPTISDQTGDRHMTDDEINKGLQTIRTYIPDFDYNAQYTRTQDRTLMIGLYRNSRSNYEKLQIYRVLYNENNDNPIVKKFVNETFHVENDFLFQLNPSEFDTIPQYIIDECDKDIEGVDH